MSDSSKPSPFKLKAGDYLEGWGGNKSKTLKAPGVLNQALLADSGARKYKTQRDKTDHLDYFDGLLADVYNNIRLYAKLFRKLDLSPERRKAFTDLKNKKLFYYTPCFEACSTQEDDKSVANFDSKYIIEGAEGVGNFNSDQNEVLLPPGMTFTVKECKLFHENFVVRLVRTGTKEAEIWNAQWLRKWQLEHVACNQPQ